MMKLNSYLLVVITAFLAACESSEQVRTISAIPVSSSTLEGRQFICRLEAMTMQDPDGQKGSKIRLVGNALDQFIRASELTSEYKISFKSKTVVLGEGSNTPSVPLPYRKSGNMIRFGPSQPITEVSDGMTVSVNAHGTLSLISYQLEQTIEMSASAPGESMRSVSSASSRCMPV